MSTVQKILRGCGLCLGLWLAVRYLLPVFVPFLIGGIIALMAEPGVGLLQRRLKWPRLPAVGFCVSLSLLLTAALMSFLCAIAVRELGAVAKMAPQLGQTVGQSMVVLEDFLVSLADRAPDNLRPVMVQTVLNTFQNGTTLLNQVTGKLPGLVANLIGRLSRGALTVGTGVLAGFLISARLPKMRRWLHRHLPKSWNEKILPAAKHIRKTFGGWLKAQLKLSCVTWLLVSLGFLLLGVDKGLLWAGVVALVDAVPVLGVGTVLVPWSVVSFLQGDTLQGAGLLAIFGTAWLVRSILEPRLVGKSLGLDPLVSLAAFYIGFKLWGIAGMILAPVTAALLKGLLESGRDWSFKNNL